MKNNEGFKIKYPEVEQGLSEAKSLKEETAEELKLNFKKLKEKTIQLKNELKLKNEYSLGLAINSEYSNEMEDANDAYSEETIAKLEKEIKDIHNRMTELNLNKIEIEDITTTLKLQFEKIKKEFLKIGKERLN